MSCAAVSDAWIVACPSCHGLARVPAARAAQQPRCARCKAGLLSGVPFPVDEAAFAAHVERSTLPLLVDFWAPWCGPCRMLAPVLERVAAQRAATLQVLKVNTDDAQPLAAKFAIRSIPTLILLREGREIARHSGALDGAALSRWLAGYP